jgi:hypothetical protein
MIACPACGEELPGDAKVCRHCLAVVDRDEWDHDAGRLGADERGAGRPLEDPPVGPIPLTGGGVASGFFGNALRLVTTGLLVRRRRRGP